MTYDVVTFGEAMIRLTPDGATGFENAGRVQVHVAGTEANMAVAIRSLGRSVAWVSRLPSNSPGRLIAGAIEGHGVDTSQVVWAEEGRAGLMFVEADASGTTVTYDRKGSAAAEMTWSRFPRSVLDRARLVHITGITPALSESCRVVALRAAETVRSSPTLLSVDVNYRSSLWDSAVAARQIGALAHGADIVTCALRDARDLYATGSDPRDAAAQLADRFECRCVVVTAGDDGAVMLREGRLTEAPAVPTTVVDRLGAGDAFVAALLDGLLDGEPETGLERGVALASLALSTPGDWVTFSRADIDGMDRLAPPSPGGIDSQITR